MGREETASITSPAKVWSSMMRARWAGLYIRGIGVLALVFLCGLSYVQIAVPSIGPSGDFAWTGFFLLLFLGAFAEKYTIRIGSGLEVSASFLAYFLSGAIAGPLASFISAAVGQVPLWRRNEWERNLCFSSTIAIVAGGAALFYWVALSWIGGSHEVAAIVTASVGLGAGILYQVVNFAIVMPVAWLRRGIRPSALWRDGLQPFLPFHLFFLAISLGLISIYHLYVQGNTGASSVYSTLLIMLCLLPVFGLIYAFRAYAHQLELARHNERLALRNERLALQAVASQVTALDLKDNYTARHSAAVAQWATDIAEKMGLSDHEVNVTHLASLLHDVGKIGVPDEVLNAPGRLDPVAWRLVETHCQNGEKILSNIDQFDELAKVVLHHHERFDGKGYPTGSAGEDIPLISRIICVADSYSAMVSDRPYRARLATSVAKSELVANKGTQFDPQVVDYFLELLEQNDEWYQRGELADFRVEFQKVKFLRELPPEAEDGEPAPQGAAA